MNPFLTFKEVSSLGLRTIWTELDESSDLNVVTVLNCMHDLIQLHRRSLRTLENMEVEQLKSSSKLDYLQLSTTRLKVSKYILMEDTLWLYLEINVLKIHS